MSDRDRRGPIWPLFALIVYVAALFAVFTALPDATEDRYDADILHALSIVFGVWCVVMLWRTRRWAVLALAVLAAFAGDALFYAALGGWYPDGWYGEWLRLIRACFVASASLLTLQLLIDIWGWRRRRMLDHRRSVAPRADGLP